MKELKLKEPIQMIAEQFECVSCKKKFYMNKEDADELTEGDVFNCPFCNVLDTKNIRQFELQINKIFIKE